VFLFSFKSLTLLAAFFIKFNLLKFLGVLTVFLFNEVSVLLFDFKRLFLASKIELVLTKSALVLCLSNLSLKKENIFSSYGFILSLRFTARVFLRNSVDD